MTTTPNTSSAIILDTPDAIAAYRLIALRRAIIFRIDTGMSMMRMQEIKVAHRDKLSTKKTLKGVLADLNEMPFFIDIDSKTKSRSNTR